MMKKRFVAFGLTLTMVMAMLVPFGAHAIAVKPSPLIGKMTAAQAQAYLGFFDGTAEGMINEDYNDIYNGDAVIYALVDVTGDGSFDVIRSSSRFISEHILIATVKNNALYPAHELEATGSNVYGIRAGFCTGDESVPYLHTLEYGEAFMESSSTSNTVIRFQRDGSTKKVSTFGESWGVVDYTQVQEYLADERDVDTIEYNYSWNVDGKSGGETRYGYGDWTSSPEYAAVNSRYEQHYSLSFLAEEYGAIIYDDPDTLKADLMAVIASETTDTAALLDMLPYIGDRSKCKMTKEQALAYADILTRMDQEGSSDYTVAMLVDPGDGIPILMIGEYYYDEDMNGYILINDTHNQTGLWQWDGTKAINIDSGSSYIEYSVYSQNGKMIVIFKTVIYLGDNWFGYSVAYSLKGGMAELEGFSLFRTYLSNKIGTIALTENPFPFPLDINAVNAYWTTVCEAAAQNGTTSEFSLLTYSCIGDKDGKIISQSHGNAPKWSYPGQGSQLVGSMTGLLSSISELPANVKMASDTASLLRAYAENIGTSYSFPLLDDDAIAKNIAERIASQLGGEILGIYKLADGVYYVIIEISGVSQGALVKCDKKQGAITYNIEKTYPTHATEEQLRQYAADFQSTSNVSPDYSKTSDFTSATQYEDYLKELLGTIPGGNPNDVAKNELATYIEQAISTCNGKIVVGNGNQASFSASDIKDIVSSAKDMQSNMQGTLDAEGLTLNREITIIVQLVVTGVDTNTPCQISLDSEVLKELGGCDLRVFLVDSQHSIRIPYAALEQILADLGVLRIQLGCTAENIYNINFLDKDNNLCETIPASVEFALPIDSEFCTVLASYRGGSDNWGGQYDAINKTISFQTPYSGTYEILENSFDLLDIDGLTDEQMQAIFFMLSKGYFAAEDGHFLPDAELSRYDFTKALVGMFFALDRTAQMTFEDVPEASEYFAFIASAQKDHIVNGYSDIRFGGEDSITYEQVMTIAANTLIEAKGYSYPLDIKSYLTFDGGSDVSDWARESVALSSQAGILAPGESIPPTDNIPRSDAALYLYRLFMLLYDTVPTAIIMPEQALVETGAPAEAEESESGTPLAVIILISLGGVALVGGGTTFFVLRKRKNEDTIQQ